MKKIIMTLALLLTLGTTTTASAFGFDWGVTGGMNLTKLNLKGDYKNAFKTDNQAGWFAGVKANVSLIAGIGFDGALLYSQQKYKLEGSHAEAQGMGGSETARSIQLPINLKYSFGLGKLAAVYVATGPQFGFNIGDKNLFELGESEFEQKNMTTSWNVGVGAKVLGHLDVGVSYNFGLSKVGEAIVEHVAEDKLGTNVNVRQDNMRCNTFQVQLTYYF